MSRWTWWHRNFIILLYVSTTNIILREFKVKIENVCHCEVKLHIRPLSQVGFFFLNKRGNCNICKRKHQLSAAKQDTLCNKGRANKPSFIFHIIIYMSALLKKQKMKEEEKRNYCALPNRAITWRMLRSTGKQSALFLGSSGEEEMFPVKCAFDLSSGHCQRNTYPFPLHISIQQTGKRPLSNCLDAKIKH